MYTKQITDIKEIAKTISSEFFTFVSTKGLKVNAEKEIYYNIIDDADQPGVEEYLFFYDKNTNIAYAASMMHNRGIQSIDKASKEEIKDIKEKIVMITEAEKNKIEIGKKIQVVKGRKVKKGTIGTITNIYVNKYDAYNRQIAIQTEEGKLYTYENNVICI